MPSRLGPQMGLRLGSDRANVGSNGDTQAIFPMISRDALGILSCFEAG